METLITAVHFVTAFLIVILILMQQGKGAEMGASFGGGSSQTVFGSTGGGSFFGKLTAILAVTFFVTSLGLALFAKQDASLNLQSDSPILETLQQQAASQDLPEAPALPADEFEFDEIPTFGEPDGLESPPVEMPAE